MDRLLQGVLIFQGNEVVYHNEALMDTLNISQIDTENAEQVKKLLARCRLPEDYVNQQEARTLQPLIVNLLEYITSDSRMDATEAAFNFITLFGKNRIQVKGNSIDFNGQKAIILVFQDVTKEEALQNLSNEARHKTLLIASASHELRTPLNGVISMLELLAGGVAAEMEEYLKIAVSSSQFLLIVVNDILVQSF